MIVSKEHMQNAYDRLRTGRLPPGTTPRTVAATVTVLDMAARGHAHTNRLATSPASGP